MDQPLVISIDHFQLRVPICWFPFNSCKENKITEFTRSSHRDHTLWASDLNIGFFFFFFLFQVQGCDTYGKGAYGASRHVCGSNNF